MSAIEIEKSQFMTLKIACCTSSFKLCPLVGEKLFFEKMGNFAVIDVVRHSESFNHVSSHVMVAQLRCIEQ